MPARLKTISIADSMLRGGSPMYAGFEYESIPLANIFLDAKNPRIVTQTKLNSQKEILKYLFEHENLEGFIKKIATEGKNQGAERPYVVKTGGTYTVVEGNTRIAAYKILTGLLSAPKNYAASIPQISEKAKGSLLMVDCSIAPNRDALLPIRAHQLALEVADPVRAKAVAQPELGLRPAQRRVLSQIRSSHIR